MEIPAAASDTRTSHTFPYEVSMPSAAPVSGTGAAHRPVAAGSRLDVDTQLRILQIRVFDEIEPEIQALSIASVSKFVDE